MAKYDLSNLDKNFAEAKERLHDKNKDYDPKKQIFIDEYLEAAQSKYLDRSADKRWNEYLAERNELKQLKRESKKEIKAKGDDFELGG